MGFAILDRVALDLSVRFRAFGRLAMIAELTVDRTRGYLVKPMVFMNRSGRVVGDLAGRAAIAAEDILVVSDDFNLPLGKLRFRKAGSAGGHNGLASIIRTLGTDEFPRLRCGIGLSAGGETGLPAPAEDFVLDRFLPEEEEEARRTVDRAAEAVRLWIETGDIEQCMNRFN